MFRPLATLAAIVLASSFVTPRLAHCQTSSASKTPEPLIDMDGVPLHDAIRNLARQWSMNYIVDARLLDSGGSLATRQSITGRWHLTALQLLEKLLHDNGWMLVTNSATSISRIVPTNAPAPSASEKLPGNGSDPAIPTLRIDNSLDKAIADIASKAHVTITIDPGLHVPTARGDSALRDSQIYVRWENVTARQALAAVLENYNLAVAGSPDTGTGALIVKTPGAPRPR